MKALKSEMELVDFAIMKCNCEVCIHDDNYSIKVQQSYDVDIDFDINYIDQSDIYSVNVLISSNADKRSGYIYSAEGVGLFKFSTSFTEEEKIDMLQYSGLSICINNMRAFIGNLTSYLPFGKFMFHSIDMQELLNNKIEELSNKKE